MSFTIHLLTRQPFPPGLQLRATWDDPENPSVRGGYGVLVGLSDEPVRELSTATLRDALRQGSGKPPNSRIGTAKSTASDRWLPQSRVFVHKGSDIAFAVGEALVDALGGVMVLEGFVDNYESSNSIFYLSENLPRAAPSKDELRAIFKRVIADAKNAAKKLVEERRKKRRDDERRKCQSAATALAANLERAAAGHADPPPAILIANDNDRALEEAVRGFLKRGELPVLLGFTSKIEYGVQYGFAACLTPSRFFVVPVDVELSPGHRFAYPIKVKAKPVAKPVYDVNRSELRAIRLNAAFSDLVHLTPFFELHMLDTSPRSLVSDQTEPLSNQRAFRAYLPVELVRSGAKWAVEPPR